MRLKVINSGSIGNAYALDAGEEILLLEAGVRLSDTLKEIDFRGDKVVGCVVTHRHGDHAKYVEEYSRHGFKIFANEDVIQSAHFEYGTTHETTHAETIKTGGFSIVPMDLNHDVPIQGFLIYHKDMGTLFFATDTYKIGYSMVGVNHFLVEANYDDGLLRCNVEDGKVDRKQANRLMLSHLSIDNTLYFLRKCKAQAAKNIILCHLSERNSSPKEFADKVKAEFGVPTYIASPGLMVNLDRI